MTILIVKTPVAEFNRRTDVPYTHAVVWNSPRARAAFEARARVRAGGGRLPPWCWIH